MFDRSLDFFLRSWYLLVVYTSSTARGELIALVTQGWWTSENTSVAQHPVTVLPGAFEIT